MGKYSQSNEDQVIIDYFNGKIGTFCDIGSNDGVTFSNVRRLVELGWSGVFVEPSPKAFQMLKENYEGLTAQGQKLYFYNFALGTTNDEVEFWDSETHLNKGDHGLLSTMVEDERDRWRGQKYNKIMVKSFRWKTFLNRLTIKTFDVVSIDIEGMEVEVMEQMDFRDTSLVCAEWNGNKETKEEFDRILSGFKVIYTSPENLIYAR